MSKYTLVPVDVINKLINGEDKEEDYAKNYLYCHLGDITNGKVHTLNPEAIILLLVSCLRDSLQSDDPLNNKMINVLWDVAETELRAKRVLV